MMDTGLEDRYIVGNQLGRGQFGVVRTCYDKLTGEMVACKSIAKRRLRTSKDVENVMLEVEILMRLSGHQNVVNLKAAYEEEDYVHLMMELCEGGDLFDSIEKQGMMLSECAARDIFRPLMEAVKFCHDKGVAHRDLKPENILLATKSSFSQIKLADFGLATYFKPGQSLHGVVGTPLYIAPEVLAGDYTQAVDVWSCGVILYILLSGRPPFWGETKSSILNAVRAADLSFPPTLWDHLSSAKDLVAGMLCVDPSKRLTAAQVLTHSWLKEDYVTLVPSCSNPPEICKLAKVNQAFHEASRVDLVWEPKLSSSYDLIMEKVFKDIPQILGKKEVYTRLCQPNPFDGGPKKAWLDGRTGRVCLSISSRVLAIAGIHDQRYWNYIPTEESTFKTVAYGQQIWWLEVCGVVKFPFPAGIYSLFLQLGQPSQKLGQRICNLEEVHGWDIEPVHFQLWTSDGQHATSQYFLDQPGTWSIYHVGDFVIDNSSAQTAIEFSMSQTDCKQNKGGLCVDSVLILPKRI